MDEATKQLFEALKSKDFSLAYTLIARGANIHAVDNEGCTILHYVAKEGHIGLFNRLIRSGAGVDLDNREGNNILNIANNEGMTPLHLAVLNGKSSLVKALLANRANVHAVDRIGDTPLHIASELGDIRIFDELVRSASDIRAINHNNETPLHKAAYYNHLQLVRRLVEAGANLDARDSSGDTPLQLASENFEIANFLIDREADIYNRNNKNESIIHSASADDNVELLELLHDDHLDYVESQPQTFLHWAASNGNLKACKWLLEYGYDINEVDDTGRTALHVAALESQVNIVEYLITQGANVNVEDNTDLAKPIDEAIGSALSSTDRLEKSKINEIVSLLGSSGAKMRFIRMSYLDYFIDNINDILKQGNKDQQIKFRQHLLSDDNLFNYCTPEGNKLDFEKIKEETERMQKEYLKLQDNKPRQGRYAEKILSERKQHRKPKGVPRGAEYSGKGR